MSEPTYERRVVMRRADTIRDDVPTWAWEFDDRGRIAIGTVVLFAGRPGAGKSTSARWLVAQATTGTLPGCWLGTPVNVAYIAREEAVDYIVKPSMRAHGTDLERVFFPEVELTVDNEVARTTPVHIADMEAFTRTCCEHRVRLVVVDPLMSTIGSKTDVNRNNEVRAQLDPWRTLAEDIDGVVIGVAHLNKSGNGDVVAGVNGSSAFGEIARAVFGFAKDPDAENGERVLSQEKNSLGDESLALSYRIDPAEVRTDSGRTAEVGRFVLLGESERSVGDVLRDAARQGPSTTDYDAIITWLRGILANGRVEATEIYKSGDAAGYSKDQLKRAKAKASDIEAVRPTNPRPWFWQRAERAQRATNLRVLPAPCEVNQGFAGSREQSADTPQEPLGALTPDSPGQTDRVAAALANARKDH
ncbi:AAA family ATPase [Gordonia sp. FQ]|uniref:AAA family ATPase n=1 Tax=Gordonia sp. FQ TaxID=3446634 RepID=UPI003F8561D3